MAKRIPKFKASKKAKAKKVFDEGKAGKLHSGSKKGPLVKHGSAQEIAIALSESGQSKKKKRPRSKPKTNVSEALS